MADESERQYAVTPIQSFRVEAWIERGYKFIRRDGNDVILELTWALTNEQLRISQDGTCTWELKVNQCL